MSRFASHAAFRSRALAVGTLVTAASLASPAIAAAGESADAAPQTIVYYSFRDLASDEGARALYQRIVSAARTVCPGYDSRNLTDFAASRECQRHAIADAIRQVGSARLAAVYSQKLARRG